jgi:hypothetical protein
MITIGLLAIAIGIVSAYVAKGLLLLIAFFTNLFFFNASARRLLRRRTTRSDRGSSWCR